MNHLDGQYKRLLNYVLERGLEKTDRTGTGTLSVFNQQITFDLSGGDFPILTTKKIAFKTMVTELKWFLRGDTNIKYLQDNDCKIWDGDYKKSGRTDGELGPIYGKQWRDWNGIDQLKNLIEGLVNNPDSRRHLVSAWNVGDLNKMTLPPCHYSYQCYIRGDYVDLLWNQRSADLFLGVPFNISSYALLLILIANEIDKTPGVVTGNFGDLHLYNNHIKQAKTQIKRKEFDLPKIKLNSYNIYIGDFDVELVNYKSHPAIKAPLNN